MNSQVVTTVNTEEVSLMVGTYGKESALETQRVALLVKRREIISVLLIPGGGGNRNSEKQALHFYYYYYYKL